VYPGQTLIVATTLAIVPYLIVRGLTNPIAARMNPGRPREGKESTRMAQETETKAAPAADQVKLALDRTYLAHERTLMAWVRTATSLIAFGFTLYKFFFYLREQEPEKHVEQLLGPRTYGLIMIGVGVFTLAMAAWQHRQQVKRLRAQYAEAPFSLSLVLAALIAALGILGFIVTLLRE
jgi:putative membrane protein